LDGVNFLTGAGVAPPPPGLPVSSTGLSSRRAASRQGGLLRQASAARHALSPAASHVRDAHTIPKAAPGLLCQGPPLQSLAHICIFSTRTRGATCVARPRPIVGAAGGPCFLPTAPCRVCVHYCPNLLASMVLSAPRTPLLPSLRRSAACSGPPRNQGGSAPGNSPPSPTPAPPAALSVAGQPAQAAEAKQARGPPPTPPILATCTNQRARDINGGTRDRTNNAFTHGFYLLILLLPPPAGRSRPLLKTP
jgi:hypothetical protein